MAHHMALARPPLGARSGRPQLTVPPGGGGGGMAAWACNDRPRHSGDRDLYRGGGWVSQSLRT